MQHYALVVDDDPATLLFLERVLRPTGMQVIQAGDGVQALNTLQSLTPDIVYMDMLMPRLSGLELLDYITQSPHLDPTYVVVVSAHNHFEPTPQLDRVDTFLLKPVRPKDIRDSAMYALSRQTDH